MKILIIEDEIRSFNRLKKLLLQQDGTYEIYGPLTSVGTALNDLTPTANYDLILADIRLEDGLSFDIFNQRRTDIPLVFVTAYDDYALQAFRSNGIDYLLKPVSAEDLQKAIEKAKRMRAAIINTGQPIRQGQESRNYYRERFLIPEADTFRIVSVDEINHITVSGNITTAYLDNGTSLSLPQTVANLETQLDPNVFFRVSRQTIIHVYSIKSIGNYFNSRLILRLKNYPEVEIIVSTDRSAQFKKWLDR